MDIDDTGAPGDLVDQLWAGLSADKRAGLIEEINERTKQQRQKQQQRDERTPEDDPARHTTITDIDDIGNCDFD